MKTIWNIIKAFFTSIKGIIITVISIICLIGLIVAFGFYIAFQMITKKQIKNNKEVINENQDYLNHLNSLLDKLKLKR